MEETKNLAVLTGHPGRPEFSHRGGRDEWYRFPLRVSRLSGVEDEIQVLVTQKLLGSTAVGEGQRLTVMGELRSYNNHSGAGRKLVISVMARQMFFTNDPEENRVQLMGGLCKPPILRVTPLGRQICDLMLAVPRPYGKRDFLPLIAWGSLARRASRWQVGTLLTARGRIQSRTYVKELEEGSEERVAYEVSLSTARPV